MEQPVSPYHDKDRVKLILSQGRHRELVGGMWEEIGTLQRDFLVSKGLQRNHALLDIGCGCFRGGMKFVEYLDAGNYYGVDMNQEMMDAGYNLEIGSLQSKFPKSNMLCSDKFEFEKFGRKFNYAIAQSVFTHLKMDDIKACLAAAFSVFNKRGVLFATFFNPTVTGPVTTFPDKDPFHYTVGEMMRAGYDAGFGTEYIGPWNHPKHQVMMSFTRL